LKRKAFEFIVLTPEMLGLQAVQKITAFVLTRSRQTLRFHLVPFRAQIVTAKVTFSNNI
jgi:hypothetical protein